MIRVLLFEDNKDFIESMTDLLKDMNDMEPSRVYRNCTDIIRYTQYFQLDMIIMDINMPVQNGLEGLRILLGADLETIVLTLTVFDYNDSIFQVMCNGTSEYLLKTSSAEKITEGIRENVNNGALMTASIAKQVLKLFSTPFQKPEDLQTLTAIEHNELSSLVLGFSYKMAA